MSGFHLTGSRRMARGGAAAVTACTARIKPAPVPRLLTVVALANRTPRSFPA
ncbi:hypothetical protein RNZ50_15950 [Paracoccaceae bacterium Fryx2]|nr:hypothetical protein [Paracoccaceae bacterium Fryx2]